MFLLRYMAKPDPVTLSDKIGSTLSPEEPPLFVTQRSRLSRDSQNIRIPHAVNQDFADFSQNPSWVTHASRVLVAVSQPQRTFSASANGPSAIALITNRCAIWIDIYLRAPPLSAYFGFLITYLTLREGGRFP